MMILTNEEKLSSVALLKKNTAVYLTGVRDVRPCLMLKASPMPDEERWAIIHRSCSGRSKSNNSIRSRIAAESYAVVTTAKAHRRLAWIEKAPWRYLLSRVVGY